MPRPFLPLLCHEPRSLERESRSLQTTDGSVQGLCGLSFLERGHFARLGSICLLSAVLCGQSTQHECIDPARNCVQRSQAFNKVRWTTDTSMHCCCFAPGTSETARPCAAVCVDASWPRPVAICPGPVRSPALSDALSAASSPCRVSRRIGLVSALDNGGRCPAILQRSAPAPPASDRLPPSRNPFASVLKKI